MAIQTKIDDLISALHQVQRAFPRSTPAIGKTRRCAFRLSFILRGHRKGLAIFLGYLDRLRGEVLLFRHSGFLKAVAPVCFSISSAARRGHSGPSGCVARPSHRRLMAASRASRSVAGPAPSISRKPAAGLLPKVPPEIPDSPRQGTAITAVRFLSAPLFPLSKLT